MEHTRNAQHISRREALARVGALLGGTLSAPVVAGVLSGCQASSSEGWTPRTLSSQQNELVTAISEMIIPETDTPGAAAAQVNRFIDKMLTEWYSKDDRERYLTGLDGVNARCQKQFGQPFLECSAEEQSQLLSALDSEVYAPPSPGEAGEVDGDSEGAPEPEVTQQPGRAMEEAQEEPLSSDSAQAGSTEAPSVDPKGTSEEPPFFRTMKELTLMGYYTSEIGMTQEVHWQAVPGKYNGCLPVNEVSQMRRA